jgi:transposase
MNNKTPVEDATEIVLRNRLNSPKNKKISNEQRERIITNYQSNQSSLNIAKYENLSVSTVNNIIKVFNETGRTSSLKRGGVRNKKITQEIQAKIFNLVDENCLISLKDIRDKINNEFSVFLGLSTFFDYLKAFHYTLKLAHAIPERRNDNNAFQSRYLYANSFLEYEEMFT